MHSISTVTLITRPDCKWIVNGVGLGDLLVLPLCFLMLRRIARFHPRVTLLAGMIC